MSWWALVEAIAMALLVGSFFVMAGSLEMVKSAIGALDREWRDNATKEDGWMEHIETLERAAWGLKAVILAAAVFGFLVGGCTALTWNDMQRSSDARARAGLD